MSAEYIGKCDSCGYFKSLVGECRECGRALCYDCPVDVETDINHVLLCAMCYDQLRANQRKEPGLLDSLIGFGMNELKKHQKRQEYWENIFWSEVKKRKRKDDEEEY